MPSDQSFWGTEPYSELDHMFALSVLIATDCLNEGIISERVFVVSVQEDAKWYRERLVQIVRAEKERR
jgi:hypothetical protein